jgi:hypothetical protein
MKTKKAEDAVRAYMAQMGSRGGKKSRRTLDPAQARRMVAVREARKAYRKYRHMCFWSYRDDVRIDENDVMWVVQGLKDEGNREVYECARRIHRLLKGRHADRPV